MEYLLFFLTFFKIGLTSLGGGYGMISIIRETVLNNGWLSEEAFLNMIDSNKAEKYFLKWKDRYGMPQCQPFGGTYKYSESISKNTITDYKNTKKIIDITNTPKWLLNSKWIKQEYYPFYESIFVSPYLQLYDAKEDKLYNVILTNTEYDEKTFNN